METIKKEDIYIQLTTNNGKEVTILKGRVKHLLKATIGSNGEAMVMITRLATMLVLIDREYLTDDKLENMHISDFMAINKHISEMIG